MPPMMQLRTPDMGGWNRIPPTDNTPVTGANPSASSQTIPERSPFMHASMPLQASTSDSFVRQLYGGPNVPTFRVLPIRSR